MILLLIFSFVSGVVTVLSPCILPILPIILSSTVGAKEINRQRPIGVIIGFVSSFTFFTLFLTSIISLFGIPAQTLRLFSVAVIGFFGISLLVPSAQAYVERLFTRLTRIVTPTSQRPGILGGVLVGFSIGLLWTPCVGPILASVLSLAIIGSVTIDAFLITLAYSLGTAIPMFMIMLAGQNALRSVPWLVNRTQEIQKTFGVIMVLTAIGIYFGIDKSFQVYILNLFPNYAQTLVGLEESAFVQDLLKNLKK